MDENQNSTSSYNNPSDSSSNKNIKKNKKGSIYKYQLISCLKRYFDKIIRQLNNCHSKFSLTIQILILSIPASLLLYFAIFFGNYYGYERMFTFDFYNTLKHEYLKPLVKDLDDLHLDIDISEIKSELEELDNIYFFRIYFTELISMGLLDDDQNIKIFPNISLSSEKDYQTLDLIQNEYQLNNIYTMQKNVSSKYIDNRIDHLSEIAKIYYYMLPLLTYEAFLKKTYINETFLIAYEYDKNNKNILGEELYFAFPKLKTIFERTNHFIPTNNYLSPQVIRNKQNLEEKINNNFYTENWFFKQDYEFRESANDSNNCLLSFYNFNYNYLGQLNKSNIVSLQNYININEKSYIINIIYFINKKVLKDGNYQHSIFIFSNDTNNNKNENIKYSDNNTYLISKSNIIELALSPKLNEYFHYGMHDINNSFYKHGISFDNFDLEKLGEPFEYFASTENFKIDLRYFSNIYLYALLFKNLEFTEKKEEYIDISQIEFNQNKTIIQNICEKIDFQSYIKFLQKENRSCWDYNTLLYYSGDSSIKEEMASSIYISRPYCICLPLFCLKNNNEYININNLEYIDIITLPTECQNDYKAYLNGIDETYKEHDPEYEPIIKYNYGLNKLRLFGEDIKIVLEDEYYIFKKDQLLNFNSIFFMIATIANNSDMKSLVSFFISFIYLIKSFYLLIILIGMFISFGLTNFVLYKKIKKVSNVIFDYEKIHEKYLSKLEETFSSAKKLAEQNNDSIGRTDTIGKKKSYENNKLFRIDKENNGKDSLNNLLFSNENILLEELLKLLYQYYNISKIDIMNNKENGLKDYVVEENELFQLLRNLSIYIPKFKLEVSLDYNFFINSKLNQHYIKSLPKNIKLNHQQVILTQSVIFELLSTEKIEDCGLIANLYFKYVTNINLNSEKNPIKNTLFECLIPDEEEISYVENINNDNNDNHINNDKNDNKENNDNQLIEENVNNTTFIEDNNKKLYIIRREENNLLDELENNFENDDYLKKEKLKPSFDSFLVNVYCKYLKKLASKQYE